MKRMRTMWLAGLVFCGIGLNVGASDREMLQRVADEAGVTIDDVRMVLGSRTQYARYRTSYNRIEPRVRLALARVEAHAEAQARSRRQDDHSAAIATADTASK